MGYLLELINSIQMEYSLFFVLCLEVVSRLWILYRSSLSTYLNHEIHIIGELMWQFIAPVRVSPLLHHRLCTGARGAEMLLRFDAFAFPDGVGAGNEFAEWQDGRLCDNNVSHP